MGGGEEGIVCNSREKVLGTKSTTERMTAVRVLLKIEDLKQAEGRIVGTIGQKSMDNEVEHQQKKWEVGRMTGEGWQSMAPPRKQQ